MDSSDANDALRPLVVGLGEILFDCFPGRTVLGGAPLNVAIHANALLVGSGGAGVPISRVGRDDLGKRFFAEAAERDLDTRFVQRDPEQPTGRVEVSLDDEGQATYRFDTDSAWDALEYSAELASLARRCDAVTFGTLGQRSPLSQDTITRFITDASQAIRLFDVNLRQRFYSAEVLHHSLQIASAVKLNEEELWEIGTLLGYEEPADEDAAVNALVTTYQLDWLALTRGTEGTVLYSGGSKHTSNNPAPFDPEPNADSVGAGDACCAGLLCGKLLGWTNEATLDLANRLGACVAARPGATPPIPRDFLHRSE